MSLAVNNNLMATNTARHLNAHYGRLATSTQRLSSGLRINSAADDAAGLAIRELQRADIEALHQGARNANDAISMIQVADGSLGIIDEKLIRMKELAEQAATGTYDSTQRLMIESEYQAMASEITRIANATDFNGTKLLDGTLAGDHDGSKLVSEGKMKIHFGTGNDSAEDYYYVEIGECTSEAFGLGNNSTWQDVQARSVEAFRESLRKQIETGAFSDEDRAKLLAHVEEMGDFVNAVLQQAVEPVNAWELWTAGDGTLPLDRDNYDKVQDEGFLFDGKNWPGNSDLLTRFLEAGRSGDVEPDSVSLAAAADILAKMKKALNDKLTPRLIGSRNDEAIIAINSAISSSASIAGKEFFIEPDEMALRQQFRDVYIPFRTMLAATPADPPDLAAIDTFRKELEAIIDQQLPAAVIAARRGALVADEGPRYVEEMVEIMETAIGNAGNLLKGLAMPPADKAGLDGLMPDLLRQAVAEAAVGKHLHETEIDELGEMLEGAYKWSAADFFTGTPAVYNANAPGAWAVFEAEMQRVLAMDAQNGNGLTQGIADHNQERSFAILQTMDIPDETAPNKGNIYSFWNSLRETEKQKLQYAFGQAAIYNLANADASANPPAFGLDMPLPAFGQAAGLTGDDAKIADEFIIQALKDMQVKVGHMDFAGHTIETQEDAQMALTAINDAIVSKDKIRAHLGAAQNRLENTVSNLNIQAENLQAAESRISDVDVATEMTQFVRNQILTQSAVAMLSQANSLPQMAMQLIGG